MLDRLKYALIIAIFNLATPGYGLPSDDLSDDGDDSFRDDLTLRDDNGNYARGASAFKLDLEIRQGFAMTKSLRNDSNQRTEFVLGLNYDNDDWLDASLLLGAVRYSNDEKVVARPTEATLDFLLAETAAGRTHSEVWWLGPSQEEPSIVEVTIKQSRDFAPKIWSHGFDFEAGLALGARVQQDNQDTTTFDDTPPTKETNGRHENDDELEERSPIPFGELQLASQTNVQIANTKLKLAGQMEYRISRITYQNSDDLPGEDPTTDYERLTEFGLMASTELTTDLTFKCEWIHVTEGFFARSATNGKNPNDPGTELVLSLKQTF